MTTPTQEKQIELQEEPKEGPKLTIKNIIQTV